MSKKMCAKIHPVTHSMVPPYRSGVDAVRQYTLPVLREGTEWYVEFYAYDPSRCKLRRKRIKVNRIKSKAKRRIYARDLIARITLQLQRGWNPWIAKDTSQLMLFSDVCAAYEAYIDKMFTSGQYRKETYAGYKSYLKNLRDYVEKESPIYYLYQFDRTYIVGFLDFVFIGRDNGGQTRNNYLSWLSVFTGWAVVKGYLTTRPTEGIPKIDKRHLVKRRQVIPLDVVHRIGRWLAEHDPYFLLACQLLYNCFIRPVEMTRLRVGWINASAGTVSIPAEASKNRQSMVVTLPKSVLYRMMSLGIFKSPSEDFLFSKNLRPGPTKIDTIIFRHHWDSLRTALALRKEWQFYSLKDTGITEMLDNNIASIAVRDQARHSSLAITEVYTRHQQRANEQVLNWEGSL